MKHLFSLVFTLICVSCYAQEPSYTPMRLNYQFRGIKVDSLFLVPSYTDTTQANGYSAKNIPGSLIRTGSDFWMRNGTATAWLQNVNTGAGSAFTLDLQEVTDNGDTTDNVITFYDPVGTGFNGSVRIGVKNIDSEDRGFIYLYGDQVSPQFIKIYNQKSDGYNYLEMKSGGDEFNITNGGASTNITTTTSLGISTNYFFLSSNDDITLDADSSLYIFADQNITIDSATDISIQANNDITIDADDTLQINAGTLIITPTTEIQVEVTNGETFKAGDFTNADKIGNVLFNIGKSANTSSNTFTAETPGVYYIADAGGNNFYFPPAENFTGAMMVLINTDNLDNQPILSNGMSLIYNRGSGATLTTLGTNDMAIFFSDGTNWFGGLLQ